MTDPINRVNLPIITTGSPGRRDVLPKPEIKGSPSDGKSFGQMLRHSLSQTSQPVISFSRHAAARLNQREIELSPEDISRLQEGADLARRKGIKDSLVYLGERAFIVNIPSGVVVTVVDGSGNDEANVFTNIDGAVIL